MMTLPEQWKFLNSMADKLRVDGDAITSQKLLQCSATIKDFWIDAHHEMMASLGQPEVTIMHRDETVLEFKAHLHKSPEVFNA